MLYGGGDDIISQYVTFCKVFSEQRKLTPDLKTAIQETIRICKDRDVLKEFLQNHETEVYDKMFDLFDQDYIWEVHDYNVKKEYEQKLAAKDAELASNKAALADKDAALADKDSVIADKDRIIMELRAQLAKSA